MNENSKLKITSLWFIACILVPAGGCNGGGGDGDNHPPVAADDSARTGANGAVDIDVLANDADPDEDTLAVDSIAQPGNGIARINPDGTVRYAPALDFIGTDTFAYTVSDGNGGTDTATVTVTVGRIDPDNHPPQAADDAAVTDENTPVLTGDVLANDTDPDGDALTVESVTDPGRGRAADNGDGTFTYTPQEYYNGTDSFTYTVSDGNGGTDTATVTITINPVGEDLYIAPDGSDENPGAMDSPLATLEGARTVIRDMKSEGGLPEGGMAVWLREGAYERTAAFELTEEDSGTRTEPIIYSAYNGETVRIVGGIRLDPADFSVVTSDSTPGVWERVDTAASVTLQDIA